MTLINKLLDSDTLKAELNLLEIFQEIYGLEDQLKFLYEERDKLLRTFTQKRLSQTSKMIDLADQVNKVQKEQVGKKQNES